MSYHENILIADDEPRMCESLKDLLSTHGYEIKTCCNGHDALECLTEDRFDLVLLDIGMEEMDGSQVLERMPQQLIDIPVIIMTGHASTASAVEALRKGAYDYLRKPFEPEKLFTSVKNALNQRKLKKDHHLVNKNLRATEERFRRLAENTRDMIYRMSLPDGHYQYISPASIDLFGYSPKEFYESPVLIRKIIHPSWAEYFEEQWANLLSGNMPPFYEYQIIHKSGEERWVDQRNVLIRGDNGQPKEIEGLVSDITDRKEAKAALRKSNEKHRLLAKKDIEKNFDPFFTSKFTGRGLGLPVALGVVRAHRGLTSVESGTGRGSIFRVFFPVTASAVIRPFETAIKTPKWKGHGTGLIAEGTESV
jgi:PAS domain S-box-containing protein